MSDEPAGRPPSGRPYRLLVVCTANQCRSVMAAALWQRLLDDRGVPADVRSAGLGPDGWPATPDVVDALAAHGLDVTAHRSRQLGPWVRRADLVLGMTNEHVRAVGLLDRSALARTFGLRHAARRAGEIGPRGPEEPLDAWLHRLADGRRPVDLFHDGGLEDIEDPTGRSYEAHLATVGLLADLLRQFTAAAFPAARPAAASVAPHRRRARAER